MEFVIMATTGMLASNALTIKKWAKQGWVDMYKKTAFGRMMSRGSIYYCPEFETGNKYGAGDRVTISFNGILTGIGTGEGGTSVGNEEALNLSNDSLLINVFRHAVNNPNTDTIEQYRTNVFFEKAAKEMLPGYMASRLDASVFNQLAGVNSTTITVDTTVYSGTNRLFVQGLNAPTAPTTNRIIRAGGAATDEALTSADTMTLDLIDAAIESANSVYPTLELLDNEELDLYLSPAQVTDLKRDASSKIQWYQISNSQLAGGDIAKNPLMIGASIYGATPVGKYANVNLIQRTRVATGQNSSTSAALPNVRRAVLCGKNALMFGSPLGGRLTDSSAPLLYKEQLQDYEYYKGIEGRMIYGAKKITVSPDGTATDLGVIVISTYAGAHTS